MLDLRLYNPTGNYADQTNSSEYMQLVRPEDPSASGCELSRKMRIFFTINENVPGQIFRSGTFFV